MPRPWSSVSVVGVGLMGGSFALALRKAGFRGRIIGVSSPATIAAALARRVIDEALPLREAAAQSDLIYLAQPIEKILATMDELDEWVAPETLVTDAGSTKTAIVELARQKIRRGRFIGGHPMAGKQSRGVSEADADLFHRRPYVLTAHDAELESWIQRIGARVVIMDAAEHDRLVALTSHLPQLISTALGASIAGEREAARVAGPAAIDMTRLAMSSYEIWRDILLTNSGPIDAALEGFIGKLQELRAKIRDPAIGEEFQRAAAAAHALRGVEIL
ncbi:MAG TPA: prephenate dehydrogenase/arogenate dehydrogenase family protein [Bryobacteraceae bacterium]|nr:prephenate dehydrogenase/arogenate dehydrogenase family protein [Bryobacteraceae bacterium]